MRYLRHFALSAAVLFGAACSEAPTAPVTTPRAPTQPDNSVITPILLPPNAAWGLYFQSFNWGRSLTIDVIHNKDNTTTGKGSFFIPRVGLGALYVTGATTYGGCTPEGRGTPCDPDHGVGVPESAIAYGVAVFANGTRSAFKVDLHSNYWPNPQNKFDTADLSFCNPTLTMCGPAYHFYGELHHEPQ